MTGPAGGPPATPSATPRRAAATTTRGDRLRDMIALVLVLAGIGLILASHSGMRQLATQPIVVQKGQPAFALYNHYRYLDYAGRAVIVIGIIVGIASYVIHIRRHRTSGSSS